jgi:hypothetical protein
MKGFSIAFAIAALVSALVASRYWYASSQLPFPSYDIAPVAQYERGLDDLIRGSARLNKWAAIWTGMASLLGAISAVMGVMV